MTWPIPGDGQPGMCGTDMVTIENDRPTAQFVSDAVPSCGYMEVNFTNTSTADAVSFLWDFDEMTKPVHRRM